jgi:hypothetical protein
LGKERRTLVGIEQAANQAMSNYGYVTKKSFEQGATLDTPNTVLQWESNGEFYRWDGDWSEPKVVPAGSTPEGAGGIGEGKWVGVGDAALRGGLASSDGLKFIGRAKSVSSLRMIEPTDENQYIETLSYADKLVNELPIGGARYEYDKSDRSSDDDGVLTFVTQAGARWKLISNTNTLPIYIAGIIGNGDDEGFNLNKIISSLRDDAIKRNTRWVIDGCGATVTSSIGIYIDLAYVGIKSLTINSNPGVVSSGNFYACYLDGSVESASNNYRYVFDNIFLLGPENNRENIHALKIAPAKTLQGFSPVNLSISQFDGGLVFGSNAYILDFVNPHVMRCVTPITDTVAVGEVSSISNAGENIRFSGGVIANSKKLMNFKGIEIGLVLNATSLDYFGGNLSENHAAITIATNGAAIDFNSTWIETGNVNSGLTDNFMNIVGSGVSAKISFRGGRVLLGSTTYNNTPIFINDESGKSSVSIDGTYLLGLGIKQWISDKGQFDKFLPAINYDSSLASGRIGGVSKFVLDPNFKDSKIPDEWYAQGNQSSRLTSNLITAERVQLSDGSYALKVQKKTTGGAILSLCVPVARNKFNPQVRLNIYTEASLSLSVPIYINASMAGVRGYDGDYGRPFVSSSRQTWQYTLANLNAGDNAILIQSQLAVSNENSKYDHVVVSINVDGMSLSDVIYIKQIEIDKPY